MLDRGRLESWRDRLQSILQDVQNKAAGLEFKEEFTDLDSLYQLLLQAVEELDTLLENWE